MLFIAEETLHQHSQNPPPIYKMTLGFQSPHLRTPSRARVISRERPLASRLPERRSLLLKLMTEASNGFTEATVNRCIPTPAPEPEEETVKDDGSESESFDEFHFFPKLPYELRCTIWELARPRRVLRLTHATILLPASKSPGARHALAVLLLVRNSKHTKLPFANKESYHAVMKSACFINSAVYLKTPFFFDAKMDTIHIATGEENFISTIGWIQLFDSLRRAGQRVQNLAIDNNLLYPLDHNQITVFSRVSTFSVVIGYSRTDRSLIFLPDEPITSLTIAPKFWHFRNNNLDRDRFKAVFVKILQKMGKLAISVGEKTPKAEIVVWGRKHTKDRLVRMNLYTIVLPCVNEHMGGV